ncbi:hypothetical protein JXM67_05990 [candidate division WOR-3 bacterium]|nr:hypothetical protein [candidate division WOR-3 bacterium]
MIELTFSRTGICKISLEGLPKPSEIEGLIESYVREVELLPYPLRVILLDISKLVHMQVRSRKTFAELLIEASRHYSENLVVVIAGGPPMIRKFTEIMCKASKFADNIYSFSSLNEAKDWARDWLSKEVSSSA